MDLPGMAEKWLDRINNAIEIQKETCEYIIPIRCTESDLRQLRIMFEMIKDGTSLAAEEE